MNIDTTLDSLVSEARTVYGNHAWAAGYLKGTLALALDQLPKAKREAIMKQIERDLAHLEKMPRVAK